jgi:hypothetical membrane protein
MKSRLQMDSPNLAYSFGGVLLTGAIISGALTKDQRWMNWHFSRLGEGGTVSSVIFNVTLLVAATIMFALGVALSENISNIPVTKDVDIDRAKTVIQRAFIAVTVCLVGVAIFPFDRFPFVHNIFGYSMLFIFLALCIAMPKILPIFSKKFYTFSRLVILSAIVCYTLFLAAKVMTLLAVEFVIFSFLYVWLLLLINGIRKSYNLN